MGGIFLEYIDKLVLLIGLYGPLEREVFYFRRAVDFRRDTALAHREDSQNPI
jgi:hypothetical protein